MTRSRFYIILALLLVALQAYASPYRFIRIDTNNSNLSYDGVSMVRQDSRGFIWIGTYKGLNRYDGTSFKVYGKEDLGLSSDFVFCISEDHDGNIWIGTDNGITKYDYLKDSFEPLTKTSDMGTTIHNKVTFTLVDNDGSVWMLVNDQGVFNYNPATDELKMFPYSSFGDDIIGFRKMLRLDDGSFVMSCYHLNIFKSDPGFKNFGPLQKDMFLGDEIEGLFQKSTDTIYVASSKRGISEVNINTGESKSLFVLPEGHLLTDAYFDGKAILLSTTDGLWRYDVATGESISLSKDKDDPFSLSGAYVTCAFTDRDNGLWVGTKEGGVNYCATHQDIFGKHYKTDDGTMLTGTIVSSMCEGKGHAYLATERIGLLDYNMATGEVFHIKNKLIPNTTVSPCYDEPYLWFGSLNGLLRMDTRNGSIKNYGVLQRTSGVNDPRVYIVHKTHHGDLIAGTTLGIFMYNRDTDRFAEVDAFQGIFVTGIAEDIDGCLWLSTYAKGVYRWDYAAGAMPIHFSASSGCGLTTDKTSSIFVDSKNRVWVQGFSHGMFRYIPDTGQFEALNRNNWPSFPSEVCFIMTEDDNGQFWISSDIGLVQFNPETYEAKVYSQADGLLDSKLNHGACRMSNGEMMFGSNNGFIVFKPEDLYSDQSIPSIVISGMSITGEEVYHGRNIDLMDRINLKKDQNSFSLHFSMLGIQRPASLRVQCLLEGYDKEWKDILSSKKAEYFNVPPGHYKFKLRALSMQKEWKEVHAPVSIIVAPGFWGSFIGVCLIILIALAFVAGSVLALEYSNKKKRREQEESYRRQKDEEMFQEKMNFFSHVIHEIKTPLTLIKTPLSNVLTKKEMDDEAHHDLEVMQSSADYLAKLVNELLDFVRIEKKGYTLHPEVMDIVERIGSLVFDYADTAKNRNLKLSFNPGCTPGIKVMADWSAMNKILNNILINAIKYAESMINIEVSETDGQVIIRFSNDGPAIDTSMREEIFKPFVQCANLQKDNTTGVGIGLPLARNLARMHSGDLVIDPDSKYTCFVLTLPVDQSEDDISKSEEHIEQETELPRLLIADDNNDLREYLSSKFTDQYTVISASNGQSALQVVKEQNIDLVITDISMPGLTGIELCREIRDNIEISHLPVIVLSARSSVESKIGAMEAGADLYIEKPFDLEYLKSSIKSILDRRMLMRNAFRKGIPATDIDMFGLPKKDEEFFSKFDSLIRENLSNTELSVDWLSEHMNMSQSTLTRKIRKLLNTTPNYYIRSVRISVAAEMLKNSHGNNITEICYTVGFSNLSYFAKCFKEQYGQIPSEYASK